VSKKKKIKNASFGVVDLSKIKPLLNPRHHAKFENATGSLFKRDFNKERTRLGYQNLMKKIIDSNHTL